MPPKSASATTSTSRVSRAKKEENPVTTVAPAPAPAVHSTLFGLPEFEPIKQRASDGRPKVDVPAEILEMLRQAESGGNRLLFPVRDANHYDTMANVLYSAGDIMNRSVTPAPGIKVDGKFVVVKTAGEATHLRVRVGQRRGVKPGSAKSDAVASE